MTASRRPLLGLLLVLSLIGAALGQATPSRPSTSALATSVPAADAAADAAVRDWLAGRFRSSLPGAGSGQTPDELLETVRRQFMFSSPPEGGRVSFNLRQLTGEGPGQRTYRYPVTYEGTDAVVDVTLEASGGTWRPTAIRVGSGEPSIPEFVTGPTGIWTFLALTALLAYGVLGPTIWRRWLREGVASIREHPRVYRWTNIVLYGLFVFGLFAGAASPVLREFLREVLPGALEQTGITDAIKGGVVSTAFAIAYQNFVNGAFWTTFVPGLFGAVLAYLLNASRFFVFAAYLTPTGLPLASFLLHIPTIIIELQAYIVVTVGSGILLLRLLRGGFKVYPAAFAGYLKTLPLAATILVAIAWYEAFEVLVLVPALLGR